MTIVCLAFQLRLNFSYSFIAACSSNLVKPRTKKVVPSSEKLQKALIDIVFTCSSLTSRASKKASF